MATYAQLISYIAHAAPATRRPATGQEQFFRPEIGFTPRWYSEATGGIDFGARWHTDPAYRAETIVAMARERGLALAIVHRSGRCRIQTNPAT